jgi:hypothetical protein
MLPKTLSKYGLNFIPAAIFAADCLLSARPVCAGIIYVPNYSFESPSAPQVDPYAGPDMDSWQKNPQPVWYDPTQFYNTPWEDLAGEFYNVPFPGEYIDNADGIQAAFIQAVPGVGFFQDYNSLSGTNLTPNHAFNAVYKIGHSYDLTVGIIGGGGGMVAGATLGLSLYYLDASNNVVTVASTTVTNDPSVFTTNTHLVDFSVFVPAVTTNAAWAGQNIGIAITSTVNFSNLGGYWDIDNVRLTESIPVPNFSFESPAAPQVSPYAGPDMDEWQKNPQPSWYDPSQFYNTPWEDLAGEFYNVPYPGEYIDNANGVQAAFIQALPGAGFFQDYNSFSGTNTLPSHDFDVSYAAGKSYKLTVGIIGGGGGMLNGVTLQLSLYYRDALSNMVTVASTTVTNDPSVFTTNTHLVDFSAQIPVVAPTDPFAGKNIGIAITSTSNFGNLGGYWDLDNVRLVETTATQLISPAASAGQFSFTLTSEPGLAFEILATTNLLLGTNGWTSLGTLTNATGVTNVTDTPASLNQRFYRLRQM